MIGFRIVLNGKQLVTAGLGGHHVLSAILSSVVRDPARKSQWPVGRAFLERELEFSVSGLDSDRKEHVDWLAREVKAGDRIEIQIVEVDEFEPPRSRRAKGHSPELPAKSKRAGQPRKKIASVKAEAPARSSTRTGRKKKSPQK